MAVGSATGSGLTGVSFWLLIGNVASTRVIFHEPSGATA
jgi:hypothetical protein